jgi:hypothetical protein
MRVPEYIETQLSQSGRTRSDVAAAAGLSLSHFEMMISGRTKLPVNQAIAMARALNVPPTQMLEVLLRDYSPSTWDAMKEAFNLDSFMP